MADKKLNEVTKVTDMAYVPVIMADGSIGQIAKADLASVVAGIFPFIKFAQTPPSSNANEILTPLIYVNMNILTNVPAQYGTLLCYGNSTHTVQLYAAATNTNAIYFRQRTSQAWTQWLNLA